jgi:hypothetical protein
MKNVLKTKLLRPSVMRGRTAFALLAFTVAFFIFAAYSPFGEKTGRFISHRIEFQLRSYLGMGPAFSKQLKVFVVDDFAVATMQTDEPTLSQWQRFEGAKVLLADDSPDNQFLVTP